MDESADSTSNGRGRARMSRHARSHVAHTRTLGTLRLGPCGPRSGAGPSSRVEGPERAVVARESKDPRHPWHAWHPWHPSAPGTLAPLAPSAPLALWDAVGTPQKADDATRRMPNSS